MMRFWRGETVRVRMNFSDETGAALSVSDVQLRAKRPDGQVLAVPVRQDLAGGGFYADFVADIPGSWAIRAECAQPSVAVSEALFTVATSNVI